MQLRIFLAILIACAANTSSMAARSLSPDALSEAARVRPVGPNIRGAVVLRAQVMLDRAHVSSGEIDAAYGANLRKAIEGYQRANDLTVTGSIDAATWSALNVDTAPILTT